jgi:hypothetical protein
MHDVPHCLNCDTAVHLNYCANCGQETRLHVPSAREFVHEFVTHYVAVEGKLWKTLKLLLFKPGVLTNEYLAGRRASYVLPLRIFLTFSILFFATLKFSGIEIVNDGKDRDEAVVTQAAPGVAQGAGAVTAPAAVAGKAVPAAAPGKDVPAAAAGKAAPAISTDAADAAADSASREDAEAGERVLDKSDMEDVEKFIGPAAAAKVEDYLDLPEEQRDRILTAGFFSYAPYAMLLLMPVFAFYLKLLYLGSGRLYGEHFLFALHTNAFAYLQITLMVLSPWGFLTFLLGVWLVFYLPTAMRRVYGGWRTVTFLRWTVLAFLHMVSLFCAVMAAWALSIIS